MNRYIFLITFLALAGSIKAQVSNQTINTSFFAIMVTDFDSSLSWYQKNLEFEIVNQVSLDERGLKQANLKNGENKLEIIELESAVDPNELSTGSRFIGLFKVGFSVPNFDDCIERFRRNSVRFNGDIVTDPTSGKRMIILFDPDNNRIQIFEQ
ncbi:MAG: VOC family protein [bacterium]|nr:VOC family protein [bacterium]